MLIPLIINQTASWLLANQRGMWWLSWLALNGDYMGSGAGVGAVEQVLSGTEVRDTLLSYLNLLGFLIIYDSVICWEGIIAKAGYDIIWPQLHFLRKYYFSRAIVWLACWLVE